jgi:hypothetical protein
MEVQRCNMRARRNWRKAFRSSIEGGALSHSQRTAATRPVGGKEETHPPTTSGGVRGAPPGSFRVRANHKATPPLAAVTRERDAGERRAETPLGHDLA